MAKPILLVTRKLPEAIEARASRDYDARLNPNDDPWSTDGAEIAPGRRRSAPPASSAPRGTSSTPPASRPCQTA